MCATTASTVCSGTPADARIDAPGADVTDPDTTITVKPPALDGSTTATFEFTSTEPGTFQCALDNASFATCVSPHQVMQLGMGMHTFQVRAVDAANNTDDSPASYTWMVDLTQPTTTITSNPPPNPTNNQSAIFTFVSNDQAATFECNLDGGGFMGCTPPKAYSNLGPGSHTFQVRARNVLGSVDMTPASATWVIDIVPPDTTITVNPPAIQGGMMATFEFTSTETPSTFECQQNTGGFAPCTSPHQVNGLGQGTHMFRVRAIDAAGNPDPSPATYTWMVDLTAPNTTITSTPPPAFTNAQTASFTFISNDPQATFECNLDGAGFMACTSPKAYANLTEGTHLFEVRARNMLGTVDPTPASATWVVDITPPVTTLISSPPNPTQMQTATIDASSNEAMSTFLCSIDGNFQPCAMPWTIPTVLAEGSRTWEVTAVDRAGNPGNTLTGTWRIDLTAPKVTFVAPSPTPNSDGRSRTTFAWTVDEPTTQQCFLDGNVVTPCTSPVTFNASHGNHTFAVRATDGVGLSDTQSVNWNVNCVNNVGGPGAKAWFHFDEAAGDTLQHAGNGMNGFLGTTAGTADGFEPARITPGRFNGGALRFTGASQVAQWNSNMTGVPGDVTLELWFRTAGPSTVDLNLVSTLDVNARIIQTASAASINLAWNLTAVGNSFYLPAFGLSPNVWHHLVGTYKVSTGVASFYVDGVEVASQLLPAISVDLSGVRWGYDNVLQLTGDIDEPFIGNVAFSQADVLDHYCPL